MIYLNPVSGVYVTKTLRVGSVSYKLITKISVKLETANYKGSKAQWDLLVS